MKFKKHLAYNLKTSQHVKCPYLYNSFYNLVHYGLQIKNLLYFKNIIFYKLMKFATQI